MVPWLRICSSIHRWAGGRDLALRGGVVVSYGDVAYGFEEVLVHGRRVELLCALWGAVGVAVGGGACGAPGVYECGVRAGELSECEAVRGSADRAGGAGVVGAAGDCAV